MSEAGRPAVIATPKGDLHVYAADGSGVIHTWTRDGWERIGGPCVGAPAAVSCGESHLVLAVSPDGELCARSWEGRWYPRDRWEHQPATLAGDLVAIGRHGGAVSVFARSVSGTIHHKTWSRTSSWSEWEDLGGTFDQPIAGIAWGVDAISLFAVAVDGTLLTKWWDKGRWEPATDGWKPWGHGFAGPVVTVARSATVFDVFALATDGSLRHKYWDSVAHRWSHPLMAFENLGGNFGRSLAAGMVDDRQMIVVAGSNVGTHYKILRTGAWTEHWRLLDATAQGSLTLVTDERAGRVRAFAAAGSSHAETGLIVTRSCGARGWDVGWQPLDLPL